MMKIATLCSKLLLTGDLAQDVPAFLHQHNCPKTAQHCANVAAQAAVLARRFDMAVSPTIQAAWLHDVSAVIPASARLSLAHTLGIETLSAEQTLPMILHQKLSAVFAQQLFAINNPVVLSAIACHTTLKTNASAVDKPVFLADKIAWDQVGMPPYLATLLTALDDSLDVGVCVYLNYLWSQRETLPVIHPWFVGAYQQLCAVP